MDIWGRGPIVANIWGRGPIEALVLDGISRGKPVKLNIMGVIGLDRAGRGEPVEFNIISVSWNV